MNSFLGGQPFPADSAAATPNAYATYGGAPPTTRGHYVRGSVDHRPRNAMFNDLEAAQDDASPPAAGGWPGSALRSQSAVRYSAGGRSTAGSTNAPSSADRFHPSLVDSSASEASTVVHVPEGGLFHSPNRFLTHYTEFRELGRGDFGSVQAARSTSDGQWYAVKETHRAAVGDTEVQHRLQEVYALSVVGATPHVLRYFDAWIDDGRLFIATELLEAGSVRQLAAAEDLAAGGAPWSAEQLWQLALQAALGVHALHSSNVAHLDIKPDNLLCHYDGAALTIKIGDFGLARPLETEFARGCIGLNDDEGDARYLCPELLRHPDSPYLKEADMYALGMTLLELAGGDPRYSRNTHDFSCVDHLPLPLRDLILRLCCRTPFGRPTAFDVARAAGSALADARMLDCDPRHSEMLRAKCELIDSLKQELAMLEAASPSESP